MLATVRPMSRAQLAPTEAVQRVHKRLTIVVPISRKIWYNFVTGRIIVLYRLLVIELI